MNGKWSKSSPAYSFATENVSHILDLSPSGRALCACGSGDQAVACLLGGCDSAVCFDISEESLIWAKAKLSFMASMPFETFVGTFLPEPGNDSPIPDTGTRDPAALLWMERSKTPGWRHDPSLFNVRHDTTENKMRNVPWLRDGDEYAKASLAAREAFDRGSLLFIRCDILSVARAFARNSFGFVSLSNIAESPERVFPESKTPDASFASFVKNEMLPLLSPGGRVCAGYSYAIGKGPFSSPSFRAAAYVAPGFETSETRVRTALGGCDGMSDTILSMRRVP